jgi:hypothetical protein
MPTKTEQIRVAILDDYQHVALSMADWSVLDGRAAITVFNDHVDGTDAVVARLQSLDIVCVMRERTPMTRAIIERLPRLRVIASTAHRNASIDLEAAAERGVQVLHTGYSAAPTIELTWALILASSRNLIEENTAVRTGGCHHQGSFTFSFGHVFSFKADQVEDTKNRRHMSGDHPADAANLCALVHGVSVIRYWLLYISQSVQFHLHHYKTP